MLVLIRTRTRIHISIDREITLLKMPKSGTRETAQRGESQVWHPGGHLDDPCLLGQCHDKPQSPRSIFNHMLVLLDLKTINTDCTEDIDHHLHDMR